MTVAVTGARRDSRSRRHLRQALLGIGAGYLAGTVSFSAILVRWQAPGTDASRAQILVEQTGETITLGGTTPTSVRSHLGGRWAALAIALEAGKAALPTWLARRWSGSEAVAAATAAGAVLGHAYPLGARAGGYGESPMIGGLAVLDPLGLVVTNLAILGAIGVTRDSRLVLLWPATIPVWAALRRRPELLGYALGVNVVLWSRLVPELRTSMAGVLRPQ